MFKIDYDNKITMVLGDTGVIRREGTFGWNPNTKKPMYWNGSAWVDM